MRINSGGVILILIGVLLLLQNLGVFPWHELWKWWPAILVAAGAAMLIPRKS